jgi:hypothetical protein
MGVGGLCIGSGLRSDVPVRTASSGGGPRPAADLPRPVRAETTGSTKRRIALRGARDAPSGEQERVASRRDRQSGAPSPTETPRRGKPSRIAGKVETACRPRSGAAGDAPGWIRTSDPRIRSPMLYPAELRGRGRSRQCAACDEHLQDAHAPSSPGRSRQPRPAEGHDDDPHPSRLRGAERVAAPERTIRIRAPSGSSGRMAATAATLRTRGAAAPVRGGYLDRLEPNV